MKFLAIPSIALSAESKSAWKDAGAIFPRRDRSVADMVALGEQIEECRFILNLGWSQFNPTNTDLPVWNRGEIIQPLMWPGSTRLWFGDMMPPRPATYPTDIWIKAPGRGGRGKYHKMVDAELRLPPQWDWQEHIVGTEYRLLTVQHRVVQQFLREGQNNEREYHWLPQQEVDTKLKELVREAARRIPGNNVIAWDCITDMNNNVYLFEGNSCPGMSSPTAHRIVDLIEEVSYAA